MSRATPRGLALAVLLVVPVVLMACGDAAGDGAATGDVEARRVENHDLEIALADVPAGLEVESAEDLEIRLRLATEGVDGLLVIGEDETTPNPNMVAAVESHEELVLSRPDGVYSGQRELTYQFGPAFYSRGQYTENGRPMEETIVVALHPAKGDRLLRLTYTYPLAEDTAQRLQDHLFAVLGEVEPLGDGTAPEAAAAAAIETP